MTLLGHDARCRAVKRKKHLIAACALLSLLQLTHADEALADMHMTGHEIFSSRDHDRTSTAVKPARWLGSSNVAVAGGAVFLAGYLSSVTWGVISGLDRFGENFMDEAHTWEEHQRRNSGYVGARYMFIPVAGPLLALENHHGTGVQDHTKGAMYAMTAAQITGVGIASVSGIVSLTTKAQPSSGSSTKSGSSERHGPLSSLHVTPVVGPGHLTLSMSGTF